MLILWHGFLLFRKTFKQLLCTTILKIYYNNLLLPRFWLLSLDLPENVLHPSFKSKICLSKLISDTLYISFYDLWKQSELPSQKVLTAKCYTVQNKSFNFTTICLFRYNFSIIIILKPSVIIFVFTKYFMNKTFMW